MSFDIEQTLNQMAKAVGSVLTGEWPKIKECTQKVLADEKEALQEIANARLCGEITDDELKSELEDEQKTLEAALLVCQIKAKAAIQKAVNGALKVFTDAVTSALKIV